MAKFTRERLFDHMKREDKPEIKTAVRKGPQHRTIQRWTLPSGLCVLGKKHFFTSRKEAVKAIPRQFRGEVMPVLTTIKLPLRYAPTTD